MTCNLVDPIPTSLSQNIYQAETIKLSVQDIFNAGYNWSGPNNFSSFLREPEIKFATPQMGGLYTVYYNKNGCQSTSKSIQINIIAPTPPCSVSNNTLQTNNYGGKVYDSRFTSVISDNYTFQSNSSNGGGGLRIEFSTQTKPVSGLYKVVTTYSLSTQNEVKLDGSFSGNYFTSNSSGNVYVSYDTNGKMNVKFCNINFSFPTVPGSSFSGSANITEN